MSNLHLRKVIVDGRDIGDTWARLLWHCIEYGRPYEVTEGSHRGDIRISMDHASGAIAHPESRPFAPLVGPGKVATFDDDSVQKYFETKIYCHDGPEEGEKYNYSEWLTPLADAVIRYYNEFGHDNAHCAMRVGDPFCFMGYFDPITSEATRHTTPCLLNIVCRIIEGMLIFYIDYRSWDLTNGFGANMAAFQLLKEAMAVGCGVKPGPSFYTCPDLHIYGASLIAAADWTNQFTVVKNKVVYSDRVQELKAFQRRVADGQVNR